MTTVLGYVNLLIPADCEATESQKWKGGWSLLHGRDGWGGKSIFNSHMGKLISRWNFSAGNSFSLFCFYFVPVSLFFSRSFCVITSQYSSEDTALRYMNIL
jgi:hypothetical protein